MRILQVSSARHFGGGERHFVDLTQGLIAKGHALTVAISEDSPLETHLQLADRNTLRLPFRKPFDISTAWKLRKFARERDVEIVHAHVARDYPLAALATSSTSHPRLVITRHVLFPMGQLHRLTRRRVGRVIAVSKAVAANLRAQRIFEDSQIVVVRHGINLNRFSQVQRKQSPVRLRVGMLGEISPVKGQTDFVRAAATIASKRDDVDFVMAGRDHSGDGQHARELKSLIAQTNLGDRVQLIESMVDLVEFVSQLDVFVSASHSEAFGLAIVDAMACGVPVVASATGGASEIVTEGQTGRLTPIGDVGEMANVIVELLDDAPQRERLSRNARAMVAERFSVDRMISETEDVYRALV